ncbi:hypothetical protein TNCT_531661 [Trichonephila clavata]|uniref:Uncharacterized protein n=1 Tax=Trichonephila clavata TaxID=2740835 RepID=A0A8X6KSX9_TRICU|nr:hypothetical protein TNCT_531661 [Trichonephila clavata]
MPEKRRSPLLSASSSRVDQEGFDLSRGTGPLWIESRSRFCVYVWDDEIPRSVPGVSEIVAVHLHIIDLN